MPIPHFEQLERRNLLSAGSLDTSFDVDGILTSNYGEAKDVLIQPDGKILVAGIGGVARFENDGSPDITFGTEGKVTADNYFAMALQSDGKILLAGSSGFDSYLERLNPDGTVDPTFGVNGRVAVDPDPTADFIWSIAVQQDARIVAAGKVQNATGDSDVAVWRLNPDGSFDSSFGGDGLVTTGDNLSETASTVIVQPDGKIVIAGSANDLTSQAILIRYSTHGELDPSFGTNGRIITQLYYGSSMNSYGMDVLLQPDGKLILAGYAEGSFALARYDHNGNADSTFGSNGQVAARIGQHPSAATSALLQPDGKIIVAGNVLNDDYDFGVARFHANGNLDTAFGDSGGVVTVVGAGIDTVAAAALQPDGSIVLAGATRVANTHPYNAVALVRYLGDSPAPGYTASGTEVTVTPAYDGPGTPPVSSITFSNVTEGGITTVTTSTTGTPPPGGFRLLSDQVYYDLTTTAVFESAEVCLQYDEASATNENNLQLFHYEEGVGWVDRTTHLDTTTNTICATVTSFSPFAVFEQVQQVQIEVKPASINVDGNGVIPVTIYTTPEFDAATVDIASIVFADAVPIGHTYTDADGDGDLDLVLQFRAQETSLRATYEQLLIDDLDADGTLDSTKQEVTTYLFGETLTNDLLEGSDTLNLFLAGKSLRSLLDQMRAAGII